MATYRRTIDMQYNGRELPEWAKWVARDLDGAVCAYAKRPELVRGYWKTPYNEEWVFLYVDENSPVDWRDSLVELKEEKPMIELNKTYKDGLGRDVRIICVDSKNGEFPIVGLVSLEDGQEFTSSFQKDGRYAYTKTANDLILPEDFTKFEIDEPVMVRGHNSCEWLRKYFAGVDKDGTATTWVNGTKWSSNGEKEYWRPMPPPDEGGT